MNQRQTSDSDHDSSRVATEQRQSTDGPATHQRRISYPDPSRKTSDRRDGRATPNPSRQTSGRPATGQRQDSDRTATPTRADQQWTSDRRAEQRQTSRATADEQSNGRRTEQRWTSDRKATDEQTGKEQTPPHQATSFPKPPLHASPTSRKHHSILSVSHTHNKSRTALRTITFLNNHLHSSSTSTICAQSACSHLDLVLTQGA